MYGMPNYCMLHSSVASGGTILNIAFDVLPTDVSGIAEKNEN